MPVGDQRRLIRPSQHWNWASRTPSAIFPSFIDNIRLVSQSSSSRRAFESFFKYVECQRSLRGLIGPRSLKDTAIEVLLQNLAELDNLDNIPKHLVKCLWHTLEKRCMLSFHAWKILSKSLRAESDITLGMLYYRHTITSPNLPLRAYTGPLISETFDFITSLSINVQYPVADLVQLAKFSNLGILEIINPGDSDPSGTIPFGVGDILLRAWGREADKSRAFSVLRILRLWNHEELTGNSLQYIQAFPALGLFDVRDCGITDYDKLVYEAEKLGWVTMRKSNILDELDKMCLQRLEGNCHDSPLVIRQAEGRVTKPLWDGSKVRREKRSAVQLPFAQQGRSSCGSFSDSTYSPLGHRAATWPDYVREVAERDEQWVSLSWDLFCRSIDAETWEFNNAACWTRIGELRQDRDLIGAGVSGIEEQTFVGQNVVSPVPMAYIRLGDLDASLKPSEATSVTFLTTLPNKPTRSKDSLAFIRAGQDSRSGLPSGTPDEASHGKRKAGGLRRVRPLKKQNIEDVFNALNAG